MILVESITTINMIKSKLQQFRQRQNMFIALEFFREYVLKLYIERYSREDS